jgi:hypothetical protein
MRIVLGLLCVAAVATVSAADEKPDHVVTAKDFAKEYQDDKKAFVAKYGGKTVEMSGTVWAPRPSGGDVLLYGNEKKGEFSGTFIPVGAPAKLQDQLRALSQGQQVTVRGKVPVKTVFPGLEQCELVKIGPSTAIPVTLAALAAEYKKDTKAAEKKYTDRFVVVRVKVLDAKAANDKVTWTVTDAVGKDGPKVEANAFTQFSDKLLGELKAVKPGDTVVLMSPVIDAGGVTLHGAFLLKEPPAGVKLPGDKK